METTLDLRLDLVEEFYQHVPEVVREIDSWDLLDQLNYTEDEIPTSRMILANLRNAWSELDPDQRVRLERTEALAAQYEPLLQAILKGPPTRIQ